MFTIVEPDGVFIAGDYLSNVEFPFIYSSYNDYVKTLDKAAAILNHYSIAYLIPGHGEVTDSKEEMWERVMFSKNYLTRLFEEGSELEEACRKKYLFFEGVKESHLDNIKQAKKEREK